MVSRSRVLRSVAVALVFFTGSAAAELRGQAPTALADGARVRVRDADGAVIVGIVGAVTVDTLTVSGPAGSRAFPRASLRSVEVSRGVSGNEAAGAVLGLLTGAAAGGIYGYSQGSDWMFSASDHAAILGLMGGLGGVLAGVVIGSVIRSETWRPVVPLGRATLRPSPSRDYPLAVTIRF